MITSTSQKILILITLIFYGLAFSICASIRYGFLADAFSTRDVSGKVYGTMEGSMFPGYAFIFFVGGFERAMKRYNSRYLLAFIILGFATTSLASGLVYILENNTIVIVVSAILRVIQGMLSYGGSLVAIDFISAQMSEQFDMVNGFLNMGYFTGHGIAEAVGCVMYDKYGYLGPFIFSSTFGFIVTILILVVVPKSPTYLSTQKEVDKEIEDTMKQVTSSSKLTKLVIIPLVATMIINTNYGVLQVMVTPFLQQEFGKSISFGGGVLVFVSVGMAIGSMGTGMILQKKLLNHYTVMALGALSVSVGLLLTFPPDSLPTLHQLAPITAFPGVFLAGIGDPLITLSALRALWDLQLQRTGILTPKNATLITGLWLLGYAAFYYSGSTIAGVLTDYLTFSEVAAILSGFCIFSFLLCVFCRINFKDKPTEPVDDESAPLLG